jgi:hypothetical protein
MQIARFLETNTFDPETTRLLGEVFDSVCIELHDRGQPAIVREVIAKRIIEAAKRGERDPDRLRAVVLKTCTRRE